MPADQSGTNFQRRIGRCRNGRSGESAQQRSRSRSMAHCVVSGAFLLDWLVCSEFGRRLDYVAKSDYVGRMENSVDDDTKEIEKIDAIFKRHVAELDRENLDFHSDRNFLEAQKSLSLDINATKDDSTDERILGFAARAGREALKASLDTRLLLQAHQETTKNLKELRTLIIAIGAIVLALVFAMLF